jgi:transposase
MSKRKYTHIKRLEELVISMRESGMTRQEIADELGLDKIQVKNCVYRYNHRRTLLALGHEPSPKGRPRKDGQPPKQDLQKEVERLRMENKLLRDFLQSTERK